MANQSKVNTESKSEEVKETKETTQKSKPNGRSSRKRNRKSGSSSKRTPTGSNLTASAMALQQIEAVANFQHTLVLGAEERLAGKSTYGSLNVPGVMSIELYPTYGELTNQDSPLNMATRKRYIEMKLRRTAQKVWDMPDLAIFTICVDSIHQLVSVATRLLGTYGMIDIQNSYLPKCLLKAQNFSQETPDSLASWTTRLNLLILRMNQLFIPLDLQFLNTHSAWFNKYYMDSSAANTDQVYLFKLPGFYKFGYDGDGAGCATWVQFEQKFGSGYVMTFDDLLDCIEECLSALYGDMNQADLSADLMLTYGAENCFRGTPVDMGYVCLFERNTPEAISILNMIANIERPFEDGKWDHTLTSIYQDSTKGFVKQNLKYTLVWNEGAYSETDISRMIDVVSHSHLINTKDLALNASSNYILTRLKTGVHNIEVSGTGANKSLSGVLTVGTELVGNVQIWNRYPSNFNTTEPDRFYSTDLSLTEIKQYANVSSYLAPQVSNAYRLDFEYAPMQFTAQYNEDIGNLDTFAFVCNHADHLPVTDAELREVHRIRTLIAAGMI